ncbi:MAG: hypothetical protein V1928_02815 [Parcubacteria group bacterium]
MRILHQWNTRLEQFSSVFDVEKDGSVSYDIPPHIDGLIQQDGFYSAWALFEEGANRFFMKIIFDPSLLKRHFSVGPMDKEKIESAIQYLGQRIEKPCNLDKPIIIILQSEKEAFELILRHYFQ